MDAMNMDTSTDIAGIGYPPQALSAPWKADITLEDDNHAPDTQTTEGKIGEVVASQTSDHTPGIGAAAVQDTTAPTDMPVGTDTPQEDIYQITAEHS